MGFNPKAILDYRDVRHEQLPHVVRFSGGRSSALMALRLAQEGALHYDRGDIVLFANTTAEHPGTYEFARTVCNKIETQFGIPCLWYEGCAVEVATRTGYTRSRTFRLVLRREASDGDDPKKPGYRSRGEAFEEMASWTRLPSRWRRMCTTELKVRPGHDLVAEWLYEGPGPARQGHHRDVSLAPADVVAARYRGTLDRDDRETRLRVACAEPWARDEQDWQDFTSIDLKRSKVGPRGSADIWGRFGGAQQFVSVLGLRADEPERVKTAMWRSLIAEGAAGTHCRDRIQPPGELIYCPLSDLDITDQDVRSFWADQQYDLNIPTGAGNCVYCFLKGPAALARLAAQIDASDEWGNGRAEATPVDIRWWSRLEETYGRPSTTKEGRIGMFHDTNYGIILNQATDAKKLNGTGSESNGIELGVPCSCTD
ncbi:MAG: hypothetical protein KTU85_08170 [Acidimicrobiia bacterium]|nr:hypothetical protein [Acidimicrobiia bacterium]MCY4457205.1 hypothetical protein [Acidimicrobiaceae bacterium]